MTSATLITHDESEPSTAITTFLIRPWQPFDQTLQLAALVHLPYIVGAADADAADEDLWECNTAAAEDPVELVEEPVVDGDVALVDGDAEAAEDGSDGFAVVEGAADDAEAGEVDDHALVEAGRECDCGGAWGAPGAEDGGGDADAAEEGGGGGFGGFWFGVIFEEALNVFEGRAGEAGGAGTRMRMRR